MKILKNISLGIICSAILLVLVFLIVSTSEKENSDDVFYLENCDFDFIIPRPWYTQIPEIRNLSFVEEITPYYITEKSVSIGERSTKADIYFFDSNAHISNTAFSTMLMTEGASLDEDSILIDEKTQKILGGASVGDEVHISLSDSQIRFRIAGIVRANRFSRYPTAAVLYSGKQKNAINNTVENISYTGAFVKTNDVSAAETYFNTRYKAMGKVGERSWYEDEQAYEFMKNSIENLNFSKEISNVAQERANAKSKLSEIQSDNLKKAITAIAIAFSVNLIFWISRIFFSIKTIRKRIKEGTETVEILNELKIGMFTSAILFCATLILFKGMVGYALTFGIAISEITSTAITAFVTKKIITRK